MDAQEVSVNVKMAGEEPAVKSAPVTRTVQNTVSVKMENVNAAQDGRGNSVQLVSDFLVYCKVIC